MTKLSKVESVVSELQLEIARPEAERSSHASTQSLESAITSCKSVIEALRGNKIDVAVETLDVLVRRVIDEWELTSELAASVVRCAQDVRG